MTLPRRAIAATLATASLAAAAPAASAAVIVVPAVPRPSGGSPAPAGIPGIAGYIGAMVRLADAPSATQAKASGVGTASVGFDSPTGWDSAIAIAIKRGARSALAIQAGHWVTLTDEQYAALSRYLVIEARVAWVCQSRSGGGFESKQTTRVLRNLPPVVFGAPKGNLLPQGADKDYVRLAIPPAAAGIDGPPESCPDAIARVRLSLTADLPANYPAGVPIGIKGLPMASSVTVEFSR